MVKKADFEISDDVLKHISDAPNIISENLKLLNLTKEQLIFGQESQNTVIKLYAEEKYDIEKIKNGTLSLELCEKTSWKQKVKYALDGARKVGKVSRISTFIKLLFGNN